MRSSVEEEFGASLSAGDLSSFIEKLSRLGILESSEHLHAPETGIRGRLRGTLLYIRWSVFDPDSLLNWLDARLRFLYTRGFLVFSLLLIFAAAFVTVLHAGEMGLQLVGSFGFGMLALAWLFAVLAVVAHEFSHGLTCKRFGGEVHEMGILFLFFMPCLYCNVSDAWLIPEKSKRLWVTFAGAYCDLMVWALATLLWRITAPETALNLIALVLLAASGVKNLFNLNPLIKFDGYYLLSDYLEVPNLQRKAFAYLALRFRRLDESARAALASIGRRERRIFAVYGTLSVIYMTAILGFIVMFQGRWLVDNFQGCGFVLSSGIMLLLFSNPIRKAAPNPPAWWEAAKQKLLVFNRRARILAVLALAAVLLFFVHMELKVGGEFAVLPRHNADVRAEVEGIIAEVYTDEGQSVEQGDLIVRLSDRAFRSEADKIAAELAEKRARLKLLLAGTRPEAIKLAQREVRTAQTRLLHSRERHEEAERMQDESLAKAESLVENAQDRLSYAEKYLRISETGALEGLISARELQNDQEEAAIRKHELEQAIADLRLAQADDLTQARTAWAMAGDELSEVQSRLAMLRAGSRPEEIEATQAEVDRLDAQRDYLERQIVLLEVRSPSDGVVTTKKLREKVGQFVQQGELIAEVHELTTVEAEIAVPEKEIADVQIGQMVLIKARAYPNRTFVGRVATIAPVVTEVEENFQARTLHVTTTIQNSTGLLKGRMTGYAKIYCDSRPLYQLLSRRLVRYLRVEFWSWW